MSSITNEMLYPARGPAAPLGPVAESAAPVGGGVGPADALRIIKQRKGLIAIVFFVLYALVVGGTLAIYKWAPAYSAEAVLQIEPPREGAYAPSDTMPRPDVMRQILETEARKVKHLSLLQDTLAQPEIKDTDFYRSYGGNFQRCLFDLQGMVNSNPIPDTQLIRVSLSTKKPDEARLLINTLLERYRQKYSGDAQDRQRVHVESLKTTRDKVSNDLRTKREEVAAFRAASDVSQLETQRAVAIDSLSRLTTDLNELNSQAADLQAQLAGIEGLRVQDLPITAEMKLIVENDPILRFYRQQVESLDIEIRAIAGLMGDQHRQVKLLQIRRDGYYQMEAAKREQLIDDLRQRYVETNRQNLARVRSMQLQLQDQLQSAEARQRDLDRDLERYQVLLRDEESLVRTQDEIESKLRESQHIMDDKSNVRVTVVQRAELPVEPSRPDFVFYLGGGLVLALLGAVGIAFLREITDTAIRTPLDVARYGQLSVLGCVPLLDDEEADIDSIELATRRAPQSLVSEAFRQVRTNLLYSGPAESQRSILITSPRPEDGKTSVAINLAVTMARSNQRVLLVDCNFRKPAIRTSFANTKSEGLSNVLTGQSRWDSLVTATDTPNLDVLTSGRMPPSPAELLGSPYMREFLHEALARYDRVLFDGPPVLLISDSLVLATQVDAVILVTRAVSSSSKGALRRAREQLERVGARVVGAILNGVVASAGGYFKEQYRDFYEYTADETVPFELPGSAQVEETIKSDGDKEE